jgi:predicted membrane protein
MKRNITRILFGITALFIGGYLLGAVMGFWELKSFDGWWTLFIIVPSVGSMISTGIFFMNSLLLGLGIWLFVYEQDILSRRQFQVTGLAILFIAFGLWLIISSIKKKKIPENFSNAAGNYEHRNNNFVNAKFDSSSRPEYLAVFSGGEYINNSSDLCGGSATAILGGLDIDLSNIRINRNVTFNATAILGGVDIFVPAGMRVEVNGVAILGGCDNLVPNVFDENLPVLSIKYVAILGGVDVKIK